MKISAQTYENFVSTLFCPAATLRNTIIYLGKFEVSRKVTVVG